VLRKCVRKNGMEWCFMKAKVFLINLDEREDKFQSVKGRLDALGVDFERISAVRGSELTEDVIKSVYDASKNSKRYLKTLSVGEIGCYMSHRMAWQKIVDEQLDLAVVLEDDALILDGFNAFLTSVTQLVNWDYIKLQGGRGGRKTKESLRISGESSLVRYDKTPTSCLAQAISFQGAQKLLKNSQRFYRPVDVDIQLFWEKDIDVLGLDPKIVDKANFDSDIDFQSKGCGRAQKSGFWKRLKYRIVLEVKRKLENSKRPSLEIYVRSIEPK
jgi:glycosyl transferase family 25